MHKEPTPCSSHPLLCAFHHGGLKEDPTGNLGPWMPSTRRKCTTFTEKRQGIIFIKHFLHARGSATEFTCPQHPTRLSQLAHGPTAQCGKPWTQTLVGPTPKPNVLSGEAVTSQRGVSPMWLIKTLCSSSRFHDSVPRTVFHNKWLGWGWLSEDWNNLL